MVASVSMVILANNIKTLQVIISIEISKYAVVDGVSDTGGSVGAGRQVKITHPSDAEYRFIADNPAGVEEAVNIIGHTNVRGLINVRIALENGEFIWEGRISKASQGVGIGNLISASNPVIIE